MRVIPRAFTANTVVLLAVILAALVLVLVTPTSRTEAQSRVSKEQLLRQLADRGAQVYRHAQSGKVRFIGTTQEHAISRLPTLAASASPEAAARAYMAEYSKLFGIEDQARQLRAEGAEEAGKDRSVVRFQQVHENVPVLGGELNLQVDGANNLLVATGEVLPDISLDTQPGVGAQEAQRTALEYIAKPY